MCTPAFKRDSFFIYMIFCLSQLLSTTGSNFPVRYRRCRLILVIGLNCMYVLSLQTSSPYTAATPSSFALHVFRILSNPKKKFVN